MIRITVIISILVFVSCNSKGKTEIEDKYKNGNVKRHITLVDDKPDGVWTEYFKSGVKSSEVLYKNGSREGFSIQYHENGNILVVGFYKNDTLNGPTTYFFKDGSFKTTGYIEDGKNVGKWHTFKDSVVNSIGNMSNGKKDGEFIYFSAEMDSTKRCIFHNDKSIDCLKKGIVKTDSTKQQSM